MIINDMIRFFKYSLKKASEQINVFLRKLLNLDKILRTINP
jgi:hypothetical protein